MIRPFWIATVLLVIAISVYLAALLPSGAEAGPMFRVIDVRAEYGHLIVEVQHYHPDGSHWFYENYTWQGRQQYKRPLLSDNRGRSRGEPRKRYFLASDGREAPTRLNDRGVRVHYLPEGEQWLRQNRPHLNRAEILQVIRAIHDKRTEDGWERGRQRLTTHPLDFSSEDATGAQSLKGRFRVLRERAYQISGAGTLMAYTGPLPAIDPYVSSAWGTVSTFNPSLDGKVAQEGVCQSWANITGAAGNAYNYTGTGESIQINSCAPADWDYMRRAIFLFDTSSLGDGDIIDSATFGITATGKGDSFSQSMSMVTSNPASNTVLAATDYAQLQTILQAADLPLSGFTTDGSTYNTWTLNTVGEGNISKTGISKFGLRISGDPNNEPSWSSGSSYVTWVSNEGTNRPRLIVTHSTPSAAITGTIGDGATEAEVRAGGTIIITLTDATWVADDGTFAGQRQNIIDGLDSAQSETYGWNAEVRDKIGVSSVVRTSATIATVTLSAAEVADYRVDDAETITVTVPASAISTTGAITATPTIAITAVNESVTVGGTLGVDGGTAAEIVAGGETIILTLANAEWVAAGGTFNAQRQNIIDGLDSNQSDPDGWDNRRADFAVTDVVRTNATVVTITLSASSAYAIATTETITAVVPASALLYGAAITGSPTFDISAVFKLSGNRVSGPIDLSAITDVAYCAIGWEASTPGTTTVAVSTSLDGGANYSSATNGSCPTGITVGESLSTITDFRMKVTLGSSLNTETPLVEGLGLLIQDTTGPALYYRLNTVPGVTITDRSANSNAGTMSFPSSQTGINSTTGVLESTRSTLSLEQLLSVGDIVSPVTGAAASGNIFNQTETGFGSLPFQSMMQTMATGGELPLKFVWVVAIGLFSIALGVVALHLTGSLMISGIGLGAGLSIGAAIGGGLIPGWTIVLFVILALALVVMRSRGALPL
jgi:hypothetical protein